jgi:hypothetical protein
MPNCLAFLLYPLPYYITFSQVQYRHILEPLIVLLLAHAGIEMASKIRAACLKCQRPRSHDVAAIT